MAKVTEIEIGLTDSYKIDQYQYIKPELRMKVQLEEGDDLNEILDKYERYIIIRLKNFIHNRIESMK